MALWEPALILLGTAFELTGVFLMANLYMRVYWYQVPGMLFSALFRARKAREAEALAELVREKGVVSLQGLAFIGLGFALQAVPAMNKVLEIARAEPPGVEESHQTSGESSSDTD